MRVGLRVIGVPSQDSGPAPTESSARKPPDECPPFRPGAFAVVPCRGMRNRSLMPLSGRWLRLAQLCQVSTHLTFEGGDVHRGPVLDEFAVGHAEDVDELEFAVVARWR